MRLPSLPTDEELLRSAVDKIRRKEYGQLTTWEHAAVMFAIERVIAECTMKRYAIPSYEAEVNLTIK